VKPTGCSAARTFTSSILLLEEKWYNSRSKGEGDVKLSNFTGDRNVDTSA
jgi:hypothetical protein